MRLSVVIENSGVAPKGWDARVRQVPDGRHPFEAVFRYVSRNGTLALTEIALHNPDGSPLFSPDLQRRYPLVLWEKAARTTVAELWQHPDRQAQKGRRKKAGKASHHPNQDFYASIATEYRANVKRGVRDPVGEIARQHDVKPSTARGWVYRARRMGLLGQARGRTAGEV